ncbi:ATP-dependent DNA helicase RecG [Candidatus Atelocyanobacterium thalassae]|jgi:ATP-dependent DNA helicase RecG|uniref:ATP-dependent DNA helicase RecG n=1 Tax=Atelocyanobacterium thalassa (isolate ALOHA) TaxID=1453429 RepID=D3EPH5_ATETH|nr:ATP-dependent DNA helicase RecG [Candidatus Atelocyanobacterium thalassa]ADB95375.1 ATP-dependent DNA helicase RecG [Candidatus Atelocyanobacterium thalassa isolate ALOHA]MCH2543343.1 ATP-dependent DNA helicase RecG [Candidatus Atelocyanobacterium sp. ALOHA_A2.5_9]|tara:strand:+ start:119123 stop:121564 length:2442 start_codon:yes stop_codon:yes gene_type:complete
MTSENSYWVRLDKALSIEIERGFINIQGEQYQFSEYLRLSFSQSLSDKTPNSKKQRWLQFAERYASYSNLTLPQRKQLIIETRQFLHKLRQDFEISVKRSDYRQPKTSTLINIESILSDELNLEQYLHALQGIGPRKIELLEKIGLETIRDLLFYYPRDYINYARQVTISNIKEGETVTIIGRVKRCNFFTSSKNKKLSILELVVQDHTGEIKLNRFFSGNRFTNKGWQEKQKRQYIRSTVIAVSGLVKQNRYGLTLDNLEIEVLDDFNSSIESWNIGRILPVYSLTEGIDNNLIRKIIISNLKSAKTILDPLPILLKSKYDLIDLKDALINIHFPTSLDFLERARRRLIFDEFFYLQLGFLKRRQERKVLKTINSFTPNRYLTHQFNKLLPFELTKSQRRVINEIIKDLDSLQSMNRLLQGDVGSGKTIVAIFAILTTLESGYQVALMAPTEVLAEQHYNKIVLYFNQLYLSVELLTGSTKKSKRNEIYRQLLTGELPLLVGTHALIQEPIKFKKLGLVIIDEQHRFGVEQRTRLLNKGKSPHVLSMTATPIPRTLALTLHGDLDISQIDELPPGRKAIETKVLIGNQKQKAYELINQEVIQGRQAYIVFPMIEESEKLDIKAAIEEHKKLSKEIFPSFSIGLLHGRLNALEKNKVLNDFRDNKYQIMVSTTVIEVGVDIPNATVMLIENAERFGLSQLHQLRGRVGRSSFSSYCFLITSTKTPNTLEKLNVLEQSQDGFFISEMDLKLRGPGTILGTRQSGLPDFALASLADNKEILELSKLIAEKIISSDIKLNSFPLLKRELQYRSMRL